MRVQGVEFRQSNVAASILGKVEAGRDVSPPPCVCVKSLRSSYTGFYPQILSSYTELCPQNVTALPAQLFDPEERRLASEHSFLYVLRLYPPYLADWFDMHSLIDTRKGGLKSSHFLQHAPYTLDPEGRGSTESIASMKLLKTMHLPVTPVSRNHPLLPNDADALRGYLAHEKQRSPRTLQ